MLTILVQNENDQHIYMLVTLVLAFLAGLSPPSVLASSTMVAACNQALTGELKEFLKGEYAWAKNWVDRYPNGEDWVVDGKKTNLQNPYNLFFNAVLGNKTFEEIIEARKQQGKTTNIADFFGSGVFVGDLNFVDSLTGVRLLPLKESELPKGYPPKDANHGKWENLYGDLFSIKTWGKVKYAMNKRHIPTFDLIVSRPSAGLSLTNIESNSRISLRAYASAVLVLARRAYSLLSEDGGQMYMQIPREVQRMPEYRDWLAKLSEKNIGFLADGFALRIEKNLSSAAQLP